MKIYKKFLQMMGTLIFTLGVLAGLFLLIMMVWGDLEASLFSRGLEADKSLTSLHCPVFISPQETGLVTARLRNPTEMDWERFVRVNISEGFVTLTRELTSSIPVKASNSQKVQWEVYPEDAAYDRIIFFRVYINAKYPYPSLGSSCGILLLDWWGLTGMQILVGTILAFLGLTGIGFLLLKVNTSRSDENAWHAINAMVALAVIVTLGLIISYLSVWVVGLLLLAAALLMAGIIIGRRLSHRR